MISVFPRPANLSVSLRPATLTSSTLSESGSGVEGRSAFGLGNRVSGEGEGFGDGDGAAVGSAVGSAVGDSVGAVMGGVVVGVGIGIGIGLLVFRLPSTIPARKIETAANNRKIPSADRATFRFLLKSSAPSRSFFIARTDEIMIRTKTMSTKMSGPDASLSPHLTLDTSSHHGLSAGLGLGVAEGIGLCVGVGEGVGVTAGPGCVASDPT